MNGGLSERRYDSDRSSERRYKILYRILGENKYRAVWLQGSHNPLRLLKPECQFGLSGKPYSVEEIALDMPLPEFSK